MNTQNRPNTQMCHESPRHIPVQTENLQTGSQGRNSSSLYAVRCRISHSIIKSSMSQRYLQLIKTKKRQAKHRLKVASQFSKDRQRKQNRQHLKGKRMKRYYESQETNGPTMTVKRYKVLYQLGFVFQSFFLIEVLLTYKLYQFQVYQIVI